MLESSYFDDVLNRTKYCKDPYYLLEELKKLNKDFLSYKSHNDIAMRVLPTPSFDDAYHGTEEDDVAVEMRSDYVKVRMNSIFTFVKFSTTFDKISTILTKMGFVGHYKLDDVQTLVLAEGTVPFEEYTRPTKRHCHKCRCDKCY